MLWTASFLISLYWCIKPPTKVEEVPNSGAGTHYVTRLQYPHWETIIATIALGAIAWVSAATWVQRRDREHALALSRYRKAIATAEAERRHTDGDDAAAGR